MNRLLSIILIILPLGVYNQNAIPGIYGNNFGEELRLNADSTFNYTWRFDLSSSWTNGKWKANNDTVYLMAVLVFDTLRCIGDKDSLVLSNDYQSKEISKSDYAISQISTGGQDRHIFSKKYYYNKNRLIEIDCNGKLNTKKRSYLSNKKYNPWYIKKKLILHTTPNKPAASNAGGFRKQAFIKSAINRGKENIKQVNPALAAAGRTLAGIKKTTTQ